MFQLTFCFNCQLEINFLFYSCPVMSWNHVKKIILVKVITELSKRECLGHKCTDIQLIPCLAEVGKLWYGCISDHRESVSHLPSWEYFQSQHQDGHHMSWTGFRSEWCMARSNHIPISHLSDGIVMWISIRITDTKHMNIYADAHI